MFEHLLMDLYPILHVNSHVCVVQHSSDHFYVFSKMPDFGRDVRKLEPFVRMEILTPSEYNGVSEVIWFVINIFTI